MAQGSSKWCASRKESQIRVCSVEFNKSGLVLGHESHDEASLKASTNFGASIIGHVIFDTGTIAWPSEMRSYWK